MPVNVECDTHVRKDGKGRVRISFYVGGTLKRHPLEIHVKPSVWDKVHKRVKIGDSMHAVYNKAIEKALQRARTLELEHPDFTAEQLIAAMDKKPSTGRNFYEVARERLEQLGTKNNYNTKLGKLSCLRVIERIAPGITVEGLDAATVERIEVALLSKCSRNTTTYKLKRFQSMWKDAAEHYGLEIPDPFRRVSMAVTPTAKRGLFPEQMQRVMDVDLSGVSRFVQLARDTVVLQYLLNGMRWGDVCRMHTGWFSTGILVYQMHKTDKIIQWGVDPRAQAIMDRWTGEPFGNGRFILPFLKANMGPEEDRTYARINYQGGEVNKALKVVAMLAKVPPISTHWGRHSNAIKAKLSGVDNRGLQDMMGHGASRTTDEYVKQLAGTMDLENYKKMHG